MEVTTILWTTFLSLVGLRLCSPDGDIEKMADKIPYLWCPKPFWRIIYGLFQIIGIVFVLGFALYLTFTHNWWYILVYIGGVLLANVTSILLQVPVALIFLNKAQSNMYGNLVIKRLIGTIMIICGIIICFIIH